MKRAAIIAAIVIAAVGVGVAVKKCPPVPAPAGPEAPKTSPPVAAPVVPVAPTPPVNVPAAPAPATVADKVEAKTAEVAK